MTVIGFLLLVVGVGIGGWTTYAAGWRRTIGLDVRPLHPALPELVLAGPYQLVRHPRALAVVLISLGAGVMRELLPIWLCAMLATGALLAAVWRDRQLALRFGEAYRRYQRAVPFLVPRRARASA
jgi:protein-S-isoprenylcysteine O-methyltransferase Ste14